MMEQIRVSEALYFSGPLEEQAESPESPDPQNPQGTTLQLLCS